MTHPRDATQATTAVAALHHLNPVDPCGDPTPPPLEYLMNRPSTRVIWIAAQLALGATAFAIFALNGDFVAGLAMSALMCASVVAFEIADRRGVGIAGLLTGVGDERARALYRDANARTSELMSYVLAIWLVAVVAQGKRDDTLIIVVTAYAALWIANIVRVGLAGRGSADTTVAGG